VTQGVFHRCPRKALTYGGIDRDRSPRAPHTASESKILFTSSAPHPFPSHDQSASPLDRHRRPPCLVSCPLPIVLSRPRLPSPRLSSCQMLLHSAASPSWSSLSLSQPTRTDSCASLDSRTSPLSDASARSPSRLIVSGLLVFQITVLYPSGPPFRHSPHTSRVHFPFVRCASQPISLRLSSP